MRRLRVSISKDVLQRIDQILGKGPRSRFLEEAVREKLERDRRSAYP